MKDIKLRMFIFDKPKGFMVYRGIYDLNWYYHPTECKLFREIRQIDHVFPLMIATGLKDRNGKQIYKDDILLGYSEVSDKNKKIIYIVKFGKYPDDEQYTTKSHCGWFIEYKDSFGDSTRSLDDVCHDLEIIGNICENLELTCAHEYDNTLLLSYPSKKL